MEPFYVKKVFVWVPEYVWDEIEHIPCPHCGGRAQPDGWNYEARRVYLEEDVCYMIGFRCDCLTDATAVDILETFEVCTCPINSRYCCCRSPLIGTYNTWYVF